MSTPRLYYPTTLHTASEITLTGNQHHYISRVMRLTNGDRLLVFHEASGEWEAELLSVEKKASRARLVSQTRPPKPCPDIWLLFAPIKAGRIDWLVEKATELGVSRLLPVRTDRTIVSRVNTERLRAHAIEAAEQTQRLDIPGIADYQPLSQLLADWPDERPLLYGDESGNGQRADQLLPGRSPPLALLTGPEGGFSAEEFTMLRHHRQTHPLSLGPRVLRADTAALASISLMQLYCGDWYRKFCKSIN